ncbi:MAG: ATP-dependent metallopeptidase FtsH/Yme1/Tma family protein, partial [Solibacillus sp.]
MNRIFRYTIFYLLIFLVIIGIFGTFNGGKKTTEEMNFYEFFEALDSKKVDSITVQPDNKVYKVVGQLKNAKEGETFTVNILENDTESIKSIMQIEKDYPEVKVKEAPQTSGFVTCITSMSPFVIIIILF